MDKITPFVPNSVVVSRTDSSKIYFVQKDGQTIVNRATGVKLPNAFPKHFKLLSRSWAGFIG